MATMEMKIEGSVVDRILHAANAMELSPCEFVNQLLTNALRSQNQTEDEWLEQTQPDDLGTGIFLVPDVESIDRGAVRKVLVPNITYLDCVQRGVACVFKWVPHSVRSYDELAGGTCEVKKPDDKIMTPREVFAYIEAQTQWTNEEKSGVKNLYQTYISSLSRTDSDFWEKRRARWQEQLRGYGLKV